jgi:hypothetical protein
MWNMVASDWRAFSPSISALQYSSLATYVCLRNISLHANPLSRSPGQVKIVKEFVWINRKFSKCSFRASRWERKIRQITALIRQCLYFKKALFPSHFSDILRQVSLYILPVLSCPFFLFRIFWILSLKNQFSWYQWR